MLREHEGTIVVVRCWCGIQHGVPDSLRKEQMRQFNDGTRPVGLYCPLGHTHVPSGETEVDRLKKKLVNRQARVDQLNAEVGHKEAQRRAEKAAKTRLKNRVANGVCPCCNRTFVNLMRHMKRQHPDFKESKK